jgi:hypothetical protein
MCVIHTLYTNMNKIVKTVMVVGVVEAPIPNQRPAHTPTLRKRAPPFREATEHYIQILGNPCFFFLMQEKRACRDEVGKEPVTKRFDARTLDQLRSILSERVFRSICRLHLFNRQPMYMYSTARTATLNRSPSGRRAGTPGGAPHPDNNCVRPVSGLLKSELSDIIEHRPERAFPWFSPSYIARNQKLPGYREHRRNSHRFD